MYHSIISFDNKDNRTLDFYRLRQKRPATVLKKSFEAFAEHPSVFLTEELKNECTSIKIYYTEYETTEKELTYQCSFEEFMEKLHTYHNKEGRIC